MNRLPGTIRNQDQILRQKIRQLKQRLTNSEAKLGWERANSSKELNRLRDQVAKSRNHAALLEKEVERLQCQLEEQVPENEVLKQDFESVRCTVDDHVHENTQLNNSITKMRYMVLELYEQHMPSRMTAAVHNDETAEKLLTLL